MYATSPAHYAALLERLHDLSVLVVGDVCLDRYIAGHPERLSREAPVPVLEWSRSWSVPGAASNPARNVAALGARATVAGVVGNDDAGRELAAQLAAAGVACEGLVIARGRPTTTKTRVLAEGLWVSPQQLARWDSATTPLDEPLESELCRRLVELVPQHDAVLVSDYRGGAVTDRVIRELRSAAMASGKLLTVDSQGDLARFRGFDCVRCNRYEAEREIGRPLGDGDQYETALQELAARLGVQNVVVTRDAEGISAYSPDEGCVHIAPVRVSVADAVGAGDTVAAVLTLMLALGEPLSSAAYLANRAAALVVQHVGNSCPDPRQLMRALGGGSPKLRREAQLLDDLAALREGGRRLVFTNGCFDLLHVGHIRYLNEARALGDMLIVGLNSDASVSRLKGPDRPIMPLDERAEVLAALEAVDLIVPFEDGTAERLVEMIRPEVYVKGGDYSSEERLPEARMVRRYGGVVRLVDLHGERSTTSIIRRIRSIAD